MSNRPEAPTIPPTATSRMSPIAIPAIAPATPLSELSREIVMGISAPPTRIAKAIPKRELKNKAQKIMNPGVKKDEFPIKTEATIVSKDPMRNRFVLNTCLFHTMGCCGKTLCNFPAAIKLPTKVSTPIARASVAVTFVKIG